MTEISSYEEYLEKVSSGILTDQGNCPVTPLLMMIQGKWKARILYEMCIYESARFGQMKKDLPGITSAMLTKNLRELETDGLIRRTESEGNPPRVEYSFTEMGRDLLPVFFEMTKWGFAHESELPDRYLG